MERFERKRIRTILDVVPLSFFGAVFAPVLRPAALIESETIARNGSPREPFLFSRQQITIRAGQEKIMPA